MSEVESIDPVCLAPEVLVFSHFHWISLYLPQKKNLRQRLVYRKFISEVIPQIRREGQGGLRKGEEANQYAMVIAMGHLDLIISRAF